MDERIQDALTKIFAGIKQLKEIFPNKEFTIDGRLVGDIGEVLAETDYYLGLKLFADGTYEEIFNGPGKVILDRYQHRKEVGTDLLSFPISVLKKLSESVPESQRILRRRSTR